MTIGNSVTKKQGANLFLAIKGDRIELQKTKLLGQNDLGQNEIDDLIRKI